MTPVAVVYPKTASEKQAAQLSREALGGDFNAGHFMVSEGKLREAIRICTPEVCSTPFQARLHRDIGYLYVAGLLRYDDARDEFTLALSMDPSVALTPGMQTPEAVTTLNEARAGGAAKPASAQQPVQTGPSTAQTQPVASMEAEPEATEGDSGGWLLVRNWLTFAIQQDLVFHSKTADACGGASAYRCFDAGKQPRVLVPGEYTPGGNQISGSGALPGTLRILIGFDRVVHPHVSLGVRIGSVISG